MVFIIFPSSVSSYYLLNPTHFLELYKLKEIPNSSTRCHNSILPNWHSDLYRFDFIFYPPAPNSSNSIACKLFHSSFQKRQKSSDAINHINAKNRCPHCPYHHRANSNMNSYQFWSSPLCFSINVVLDVILVPSFLTVLLHTLCQIVQEDPISISGERHYERSSRCRRPLPFRGSREKRAGLIQPLPWSPINIKGKETYGRIWENNCRIN